MKSYNKIVARMTNQQLTLEQLGITMEDIVYLKNINYTIKDHYDPRYKDYVYYIVKGETAYIKISEAPGKGQVSHLKILEISDLHAGCKNFDKQGLDKTLKEAEARGIEYIHMSGDLIDGFGVYKGHVNNLKFNKAIEQIEELVSVLEKYDFWYIASSGNHDQSYCINGGLDPIKYLEATMARKGKKFTYLNSYEGNIVHAGVVFRLIHLQGSMSRATSYKLQRYLSNVFQSNLNDVVLGNKSYNLRSIQAGHFHIKYSISMSGTTMIMPGNFQDDGDLEKRMGISGKTGGVFRELSIYDNRIIKEKIEFYNPWGEEESSWKATS